MIWLNLTLTINQQKAGDAGVVRKAKQSKLKQCKHIKAIIWCQLMEEFKVLEEVYTGQSSTK